MRKIRSGYLLDGRIEKFVLRDSAFRRYCRVLGRAAANEQNKYGDYRVISQFHCIPWPVFRES
jgi:hypothetical protein